MNSNVPGPEGLAKMPIEQQMRVLLEKRENISEEIAVLRRQQKVRAISQIIELAELYDIDAGDIFQFGKGGVKRLRSQPKYMDPETGDTWTGRGKAPGWMAGKDHEYFRI